VESSQGYSVKFTLTDEHWYPAALSVGAIVVALYFDFMLPAARADALLSATISVGAILAGFLGTAKSILMTLPPDGLVAKLRTSGYLEDLARYLAEALAASLLFCLVSVFGFFSLAAAWPGWYGAAWIGFAVYGMLTFWRAGRIMLALLRLDPNTL
jgi:hypothetical protein